MKITKTAAGKKAVTISKSEWQAIGKKAGWMKESQWAIPANQQGASPMSGMDTQPQQNELSQSGVENWAISIGEPALLDVFKRAVGSNDQAVFALFQQAMQGDEQAKQTLLQNYVWAKPV